MLSDYDYIAIFDADFKPEPDFLVGPYITLPYPTLPFAAAAQELCGVT
jgi:hypothetical protein